MSRKSGLWPAVSGLLRGIIDLLYPSSCVLCARPGVAAGCSCLCDSCLAKVWQAEIPAVRQWRDRGAPASGVRQCDYDLAAWYYDGAMATIIPLMKYRNRASYASYFGEAAAERLLASAAGVLEVSSHSANGADSSAVLIPVPLHPRRQRDRGFNQSLLIANALGARWHVRVSPRSLRRIRFTQPQARLDARTRASNVAGAFAPSRHISVQGCTVLLVDDVITTGSTVDACARILKQAGAASVVAIALARAGHGAGSS